jgi:hypothetical protein
MKTLFKSEKEQVQEFAESVHNTLKELNLNFNVKIDFQKNYLNKIDCISIEPTNYKGNNFDGMQILYTSEGYEISEYQAGENKNELHIYNVVHDLKLALCLLALGNGRKPIKIWD